MLCTDRQQLHLSRKLTAFRFPVSYFDFCAGRNVLARLLPFDLRVRLRQEGDMRTWHGWVRTATASHAFDCPGSRGMAIGTISRSGPWAYCCMAILSRASPRATTAESFRPTR